MSGYVAPSDPLVAARLEAWRDRKLGLMLHWGLYSVAGVVESWGLCPEDQPWCDREGVPWDEYVRWYHGLIADFDPRELDAARWARAARDAGMGYVVLTTKHHDGFCLWDTRETEHRVTAPACPFHDDPRADLVRTVFDSFRAEGLATGAYFSKADWRHPDYWTRGEQPASRTTSYDTRANPERWRRFVDFTHAQIAELMTGYGPIDTLWLDGGWVRPRATITDEVRSWGYPIPDWDEDLEMAGLAAMARRHQPGLLVVDRTVHGPFEDYRTPEQRVPERVLPYPWETCLTLTASWGWVPEPTYKSVRELVHTLVDVVAKGGNLLLNVGPTAQGTWDAEATDRLAGIGAWMDRNGAAIHGTRPVAPHVDGPLRYTRGKDGTVYAIVLGADAPPASVTLRGVRPAREVRLLETGAIVPSTRAGDATHVDLRGAREALRSEHAWVLTIAP